MALPPRSQLVTYGLVALAVLLVGWRALAGGAEEPAVSPGGLGAEAGAAGAGAFRIGGGQAARLVVDVAGAVRRPGVYELPEGSRVLDAIRRAGGATREALPGGINRAALVVDGQQVVVPGSVPAGAAGAGSAAAGSGAAEAPISLGTATSADLEEIEGIGPVTAEKIIEFRDQNGGIGSVDQLDEISGIGPVTMESLRAALQP